MNIRKMTTKELQELREWLLTERMQTRNAETWRKYAAMSAQVKHELDHRKVGA